MSYNGGKQIQNPAVKNILPFDALSWRFLFPWNVVYTEFTPEKYV